MTELNTVNTFFNADAHFETIIHLPSAVGTDKMSDTFKDFLEELFDLPEDHELFNIKNLKLFVEDEDEELLQERLCLPGSEIKGFIFKMITPVRERIPNGKAVRSSWGYCHYAWGYAKTWPEAEQRLLIWAAAMHEDDLRGVLAMSHLPAIPTIPGELTELAQEFNEGEHLSIKALDTLTNYVNYLSIESRMDLVQFLRFWRARSAQIRLIFFVKLSGMEI